MPSLQEVRSGVSRRIEEVVSYLTRGPLLRGAVDKGFDVIASLEKAMFPEPPRVKSGFFGRRQEVPCVTSSGRKTLFVFVGGVVVGYVIAAYVEPAARSAYKRLKGKARVKAREYRIFFDSCLSFLSRSKKKSLSTTGGDTKKKKLSVEVKKGDEQVDADELRRLLQDGELISFAFDGASYAMTSDATFASSLSHRQDKQKLLGRRRAQEGRVFDDCAAALSRFSIYDTDPSLFLKAADSYVDKDQRTRFNVALRLLSQRTSACVAILRLIRRPSEPSEPPRSGDLVILWVPDDSKRSLQHRKSTTPIVVNQLIDALTAQRALAPYTVRLEATKQLDLLYDTAYAKLFQLPIVR